MEDEGLILLEQAGREVGLPVVTEMMDAHDIERVVEHADMLQVGARNAQNFSLLRRLGKASKPILLKRGMSTRLEEFLMAAEYILSAGNPNVVLCERGIRTFETATRNTLDLNAIPLLKEWTHLPVIVDPSHGTGIWSLVIPMALAAVAAGADGLHDRGPSRAREGAFRRSAATAADSLRRTDALAAAGRGGGRSHGLALQPVEKEISCGSSLLSLIFRGGWKIMLSSDSHDPNQTPGA